MEQANDPLSLFLLTAKADRVIWFLTLADGSVHMCKGRERARRGNQERLKGEGGW